MGDDHTFSTSSTSGTIDRRRRTLLIGGIVIFVICIVAIVVGVVVGTQNKGSDRDGAAGALGGSIGSATFFPTLPPRPAPGPTKTPTTPEPTSGPSFSPILPGGTREPSFAPVTSTPTAIVPTQQPTTFAPIEPDETKFLTIAPIAPVTSGPIPSTPVVSIELGDTRGPSDAPIAAQPTVNPVGSAPVTSAPDDTNSISVSPTTNSPTNTTTYPVAPSPVSTTGSPSKIDSPATSPPNSQKATASPVAPPTLAPTPASRSVIERLIREVAIFGGAEFEDSASYQSKALAWLLKSNTRNLIFEKKLIQRYALACIYYATNSVSTIYTDVEYGIGKKVPGWITEDGWLNDPDECTWYRIICNNEGLVTAITLASNQLSGTFPREVILLHQSLLRLDLYDNIVFNEGDEGNSWLGELTSLKYLFYGSTNFAYDGIPTEINRLTDLIEYDCSYTLYIGEIPGEAFHDLTNLNYLVMGGNAYNASIPVELARLPNLEYMYADNCFLEGTLDWVTEMPKIFELWLDINPGLVGTIPQTLGASLQSISWTECSLTGALPVSVSSDMQLMWLYRNFLTGTIPSEYGSLARLETLELYDNLLSGSMPSGVCSNIDSSVPVLSTLTVDCDVACDCCTCCGSKCYEL